MGSKNKHIMAKTVHYQKSIPTDWAIDKFYPSHPSWGFSTIDNNLHCPWNVSNKHIGGLFWSEILPALKNFESMTYSEIFIKGKKFHHSISPDSLNDVAIKRLEELQIEANSIYSLRLTATHRLYGYISGTIFRILWYDDNHGDNDTCVCRSRKK